MSQIRNKLSQLSSKILEFKEIGVLTPLIAFSLFVGITHPVFFSTANLISMIREASFIGLIAYGMTFVLVGAGIDISVGSILGLSGAITAIALVGGVPVVPSILIGILVGLVCGSITGSAVVGLRIPSLIASLGMLYAARGLSLLVTKGKPIVGFPDSFLKIGSGNILGIPIPIILFVVFGVIAQFVLNHTKYGYWVRALGGNRDSARLSGIPIRKLELSVYLLSGGMAGFVGVLVLSRLSAAYSQTGRTWELLVIASVIIGGTSLFGGVGTIVGTVIGATIIRVLNTSLVILRVNANWQEIAIGVIIVAAVAFDAYQRRLQQKQHAQRAIATGEKKVSLKLDLSLIYQQKKERQTAEQRAVVLDMSGITKYFGFVRALNDVNLQLYDGEVLAMVGDNGAGKSTLIKIASGALMPDQGRIKVFDQEVLYSSPKDAMGYGIATVYQHLALVDCLDVATNLFLGREPVKGIRIDKRRMLKKGNEILNALRIDIPSPKVAVGNLSGGQRQVVAIAKAISQGGRIIILDEPTAAIGVEQQAKVLELILALRHQGCSVIVVSHNLYHVFSVADRIMVLRGGHNAGSFIKSETNPDHIVSVITGSELVKRAESSVS